MSEEKKEEFVVWQSPIRGRMLHDGKNILPPPGWIFVESGDPGLTRRLKTGGDYWLMVHKRRNRIESVGLWADEKNVAAVKAQLEAERSDPAYLKKLESGRRSRAVKQEQYVLEFRAAVLAFLNFHPNYSEFAERFADAVTAHAVPVGSGTVARTELIPIERRAEAAVIAWMRHRTTAYDTMPIARIKGERREVRRELAERSRLLLKKYRSGEGVATAACPLAKELLSMEKKTNA